MGPMAQAVLATVSVSLVSFVGVLFVLGRKLGQRGESFMLSFAAGVLLATSFLDLVPEAIEKSAGEGNVFVATLVAIIGFFALERVLHGEAHGHVGGHAHAHHDPLRASRYLILVGNGLHNFIDGVLIAASFAASTELGLVTTFAVTVHEIPHEFADFGILIAGGYDVRRALLLNFGSGLTSVLGAVVFFGLTPGMQHHVAWLLATTVGMFVYIAGSDLIPQLHDHSRGPDAWIYGPFIGGVGVIAALGAVITH
jgi:zinc and cadmium transporter